MSIQFGTTERTEILDDNGSTMTKVVKHANGSPTGPVRLRYEIRHRTDKTNIAAIEQIADALLSDFSKLDAVIKLERTKTGEQEGYFNLVECYTVLVYNND